MDGCARYPRPRSEPRRAHAAPRRRSSRADRVRTCSPTSSPSPRRSRRPRSRPDRVTSPSPPPMRRGFEPRGLRRLLKAIGSARDGITFPLAMGLTTMGIAGLLLATIPSALSGAGGAAPSANLSPVGEAGADARRPHPPLRPHPRLLPPRLRRRGSRRRGDRRLCGSAQPRPPRRPVAARSSPATTAMRALEAATGCGGDAAVDPRRRHGAFGAPGRRGHAPHRWPGVVPPPLHRPPPLDAAAACGPGRVGSSAGSLTHLQCARSPAHSRLALDRIRRPLRACAGTICGRRPGLARTCRRPPRRHPEAKPWNA